MFKKNNKVQNIIGIVPAGGKGSRLAPFPCPKELFPIGYQDYEMNGILERRPKVISQYLLEQMLLGGVNQFYFIISDGKSDIMKYYGNGSSFKANIAYLYQENPNGMARAINLANAWVRDSTIVFGMPDTIIEPHDAFLQLVIKHRQEKNDLTLGLFTTDEPSKFGMVKLSSDGSVISTVDKPSHTNLKYMWGCCCWEPEFTALINEYLQNHKYSDHEIVLGEVFNEAIFRSMKVGWHHFAEGQYLDIGTSTELDMAVKKFHL